MKVGVFIVPSQKGDGINLQAIANYVANLPKVEKVRILDRKPRLKPEELAAEIRSESLQRIVLAGLSPGYFKPVFTRAMAMAGGEPEEVRLASFREHGASAGIATERAKAIVAKHAPEKAPDRRRLGCGPGSRQNPDPAGNRKRKGGWWWLLYAQSC